ncbi:hemicentin-1-like, partial [Actinia tenebrosa]|uniref:Hemicentin-1-like n=1 Tax=Actinia tenebrosa TaxID=6105 RepID=A0A6P8HAB2_ACTTE
LPTITALLCQGCQDGSAVENQTITLLCNATGKPIPNIRFMKNEEYYNGSSSVSSPINKLVFQQVAINDRGNYTCIADNGVGNPYRESLTLHVKYKPTNTLLSPTKVDVCENTDITLNCTADAYPSVKNYSLYNGNTYIGSSSSGQFSTTPRSLGWNKFCCVASNEIGSGQCAFSDVHVLDKPENTGIKITPDKKDFCTGESINISCTSDAKPAPVYSLYRNNVFNGSNGNGVFVVKLAENGNYTFTCVSSNTVGVGPNKSKSVTVRGPLIKTCKIGNEMITNKTVVEGSEVFLRLISSEMVRLGFTWKNNTVNILREVGHSLTIKSITRYQGGMYQVAARDRFNCSADMTCNFSLNVQYIDPLEVIGSSNKSYSQSNSLVLFNLSINAYPSNTSLSCNPCVPNILTTITSHDAELTRKQYLVFVVIQNDVDSASIVCKAENSVGVRERTLYFYRQQILFKEAFTGQFRITNQEWQDDLQDVKSVGYNDLKQKCIKILEAAYLGVPYLAAINIKDFIKGSIIVRIEIEVIGKVPDPLLPLRDYIKSQAEKINGLQIDYNSIQKSNDQENKPIPCKEENKTLLAVLGALFGLSIVLIIILIVGFLWSRRKDSKGNSGETSNTSDKIGQMNDISLQETSFNATDNETPNMPEYEPIGRRGLSTSNAGIPEYEAVTTRTQQSQPHSGVRTNNLMPQYESTDQHGQTEAVSNPPPVTYHTIQHHTGNYDSLSPSTRLSPKGVVLSSTGSPTRTGEYQALQHKGVSPQYQSLDDLSKC